MQEIVGFTRILKFDNQETTLYIHSKIEGNFEIQVYYEKEIDFLRLRALCP